MTERYAEPGRALHAVVTCCDNVWPELDLESQAQWAEEERRVLDTAAFRACGWYQVDDEDPDDIWYTACGRVSTLDNGTPADNLIRYCCFCGGALPNEEADHA